MRAERESPGASVRAGAGNVHRLAADDFPDHSAQQTEIESYAVDYVSRRYRLTPSVARLVCRLARIGEVLA